MKICALAWTILSIFPAVHGFCRPPGSERLLEEQGNLVGEGDNYDFDWLEADEVDAKGNLRGSSDHRNLAFERMKVFIPYAAISSKCVGLACGADAPFFDRSGKELGKWYDTAIDTPHSFAGTMVFVFKGSKHSINLSYHCFDPLYAITGGTGKYVGASGEAVTNDQANVLTFLLKIIT